MISCGHHTPKSPCEQQMDEMLLAPPRATGKGHPTQGAGSNLSPEAGRHRRDSRDWCQPMLLTTWHHAPAARMEPEQRWLQSCWQRDTGSVLLWWGTEQKGPRCGAGLGGDVQTCQGRHPWLQADEKVPFKTYHHPGLPTTAAGQGWLGGSKKKGTSQEEMCPTSFPKH